MSSSQIRNNDNDKGVVNESVVKAEVKKLLKEKYDVNRKTVDYLRNKYNDAAVIGGIMEEFSEAKSEIDKFANKFVKSYVSKYGGSLKSMTDTMKKLQSYKSKYKLTDDQFEAIKMRVDQNFFDGSNTESYTRIYPNTNLGRALGSSWAEVNDGIKTTSTEDYQHIQSILRNYNLTKKLHSDVIIQTIGYSHLDLNALTGKFDINRHNPLSAVNPVIAALFLIKNRDVEERMLYSNIAGLVSSRYNKLPITTKPDNDLLYYLINDPTDIVCSSESAMKDIHDRSIVQIQLWNNVYNLRNGKYFDATSADFLNSIDTCKITNYDNPDLVVLGDEGIILRRLFSVFAFRPIIVSTTPVFSSYTQNPFNLPTINNVITSIPYIVYKIPTILVGQQNQQVQQFSLDNTNSIVQFYLENDVFVPKATYVLNVNGPLIYYIPRRSMTIPMVMPFTLSSLPLTNKNNTLINKIPVNIPYNININNNYAEMNNAPQKVFVLLSVVSLDIKNMSNNNIMYLPQYSSVVTGQNTYLLKYPMTETGDIFSPSPIDVYEYSPQNVMNSPTRDATVNRVQLDETFENVIKTLGVIFVYGNAIKYTF